MLPALHQPVELEQQLGLLLGRQHLAQLGELLDAKRLGGRLVEACDEDWFLNPRAVDMLESHYTRSRSDIALQEEPAFDDAIADLVRSFEARLG